jgi:hypothetical protein
MIYKMCDRTDGVAGHVCIARSKDARYWEFWNRGRWLSVCDRDKKIDYIYDVFDNLIDLNQYHAINLLMKYMMLCEENIDTILAVLVITLPIKKNAVIFEVREQFLDSAAYYDRDLIVGLE